MRTLSILVFSLTVLLCVFSQCPSNPLTPGDHTININHDGRARSYLVHIPTGYTNTRSLALVLSFHGLGDNPNSWGQSSKFSSYSDQTKEYVVAYPAGVENSFNAGECCLPAKQLGVDDFGFARVIVQEVSKRSCIDPNRVFVTGYSNGCFMSQGLSCLAPDIFASAACGSGGEILLDNTCNIEYAKFNTSINIFEIHGTADVIVPYEGNPLLGFPPVQENYAANRNRLKCQSGPRVTLNDGRFYCEEYYNCFQGARIEQCTVTRGMHEWFNYPELYNTEYILNFFGLAKGINVEDQENLSDKVLPSQKISL